MGFIIDATPWSSSSQPFTILFPFSPILLSPLIFCCKLKPQPRKEPIRKIKQKLCFPSRFLFLSRVSSSPKIKQRNPIDVPPPKKTGYQVGKRGFCYRFPIFPKRPAFQFAFSLQCMPKAPTSLPGQFYSKRGKETLGMFVSAFPTHYLAFTKEAFLCSALSKR